MVSVNWNDFVVSGSWDVARSNLGIVHAAVRSRGLIRFHFRDAEVSTGVVVDDCLRFPTLEKACVSSDKDNYISFILWTVVFANAKPLRAATSTIGRSLFLMNPCDVDLWSVQCDLPSQNEHNTKYHIATVIISMSFAGTDESDSETRCWCDLRFWILMLRRFALLHLDV